MTQLILDNDSRIPPIGRNTDIGNGVQSGYASMQRRFTVVDTPNFEITTSIIDTGATNQTLVAVSIDYGDPAYVELTSVADIFTGQKSHIFTLPDSNTHNVILTVLQSPTPQYDSLVLNQNILVSIGIADAATLTAWPQTGPINVGVFGDSWCNFIYAWHLFLDPTKYSVYPVGFGGATAEQIDDRIDFIANGIAEDDPPLDYVIIGTSVNDSNAGVTKPNFKTFLSSASAKVRAQHPEATIIIPGIPDNIGAAKPYGEYSTQQEEVAGAIDDAYFYSAFNIPAVSWEADNAHLDFASRKLYAAHIETILTTLVARGDAIKKSDGDMVVGITDVYYGNPITPPDALSPVNNGYYPTSSKLVSMIGSGGELFYPGGDTERVIWGTGAGDPSTKIIDPVDLRSGEIFEIASEGGESRVFMWNGTNFERKGGVILPTIAKIGEDNTSSVSIVVNNATLTVIPCNQSIIDNSGQMVDITGNGSITPIRNGIYTGAIRSAWIAGAGGSDDHSLQHRIMYDGGGTNMINLLGTWIKSVASTTMPIFGGEGVSLTPSDVLDFRVYHSGVVAEVLSVFRTIDTSNQYWIQVTEVDPR